MEEEFLVRKYASVLVARGNLKRTFHRAVSPLSEYEPDFVRVAKGMISQNSMHDVILVDKVMSQNWWMMQIVFISCWWLYQENCWRKVFYHNKRFHCDLKFLDRQLLTEIRLFLKEQSDLGLHWLPFFLHLFDLEALRYFIIWLSIWECNKAMH